MNVRNSAALKRSRLSAALFAALMVPMASVAIAQEADTQDPPEAPASQNSEATTLDKVVVTGSRIKRAEVEGPSPVIVITAAEIEKQGFSTVYDTLNTLTQFTGSVQNELNQNGFTPNASFLNLRGLGPGYQLVLINGRRAADYPLPYNSQSNAVDLSNIPAAAIERIEVLSGGASAIYGSDAVAGVVNIIMKTNYEGNLLTVRGGTTSRGGGDVGRVQWVGGTTGDNWSLTYAFESLEREAIFASQRDFMDSYFDQPAIDRDDVNPVEGLMAIDGFDSSRWFGGPAGEDACSRFPEFDTYYFETSAVYQGPRCGYFGYPATQAIRNKDSNLSGYMYGTFDFSNGMQGYAQLSFTSAKAKLAGATQFWSTPYIYVPDAPSTALPVGSIIQLQRIFTPDEVGGINAQDTRIDEKSFDFAAGLRGTMFNDRFDWDATISHAEYELDSSQPRFLENKINDYFLGEQQGFDPYFGAYPVYNLDTDRYFNPIDAVTFQGLNTRVKDHAKSEVTQASFVFSGDLFDLPAGSVGMAATIEGASQKYNIDADPRTSPDYAGDEPIYNLTSTGGGGERDRYALGVEFSVPIFSQLTANLAGRYDKYDDITAVDDAVTWQAGLQWRPFESLLIRGSHATSFRAPDMHYIFADTSGFFTTVFDEYRCRRDGGNPDNTGECTEAEYNYQVFGTRHGNPGLEEETGKSTTAGFVWDITEGMSVSLDWYSIKLEGGVNDISTSYLLRNEADCLLGQERDGTSVDGSSAACQYFTGLVDRTGVDTINDDEIDQYESIPYNQSMIKTTGIDGTWRYRFDTDRWGDYQLQLGWTHVLKLEQQEFPGSPIDNIRDDPQYFNFRSRVNWQVDWQRDDWAASLYGFRWGSLPNWAETGRIAPYIIWNASVSKKITDKAKVGFYVSNIFDKLHPRDDTFDTYPFFWRAYSPIGREMAIQFDYKFN